MYKELHEITAQLTGEGGPFEIATVEIDTRHIVTAHRGRSPSNLRGCGDIQQGDARQRRKPRRPALSYPLSCIKIYGASRRCNVRERR